MSERYFFSYRQLHTFTKAVRSPKSPYYSPELAEELSDWFPKKKTHKDTLTEMILNGEEKPKDPTLSATYRKLTNQKTGNPEFIKLTEENAPGWVTKRDLCKVLLKIALTHKTKPKPGTTLSGALSYYMYGKHKDEKFAYRIRSIVPDWFFKGLLDIKGSKRLIKRIASKGLSPPNRRSPNRHIRRLGQLFNKIVYREGYYDPVFIEELRRMRPDWFSRRKKRKITLRDKKERSTFFTYKEAKKIVQQHGIKSWRSYESSHKHLSNNGCRLPSDPRETYKEEWENTYIFFGKAS